MQLGIVGLGGMGANMVRRLLRAGHACVAYDRSFSDQEVVHCKNCFWLTAKKVS